MKRIAVLEKGKTMGKNIIDAIVVIVMVICITMVSLKLDNTIVLGWYIVPGFIRIFSIFEGYQEREYDDGL